MLFNSIEFIFFFLPATVCGYFVLAKIGGARWAMLWLTLASLVFYSYWDIRFLPILCSSIVFNYLIGLVLAEKWHSGIRGSAQRWLIFGVAVNLLILAYCKYANLFLLAYNDLTRQHIEFIKVLLPLGISFFTFTQIAFLVDVYRGKAREHNAMKYALFVSYFPHLIAGPILHHREMMPQFGSPNTLRPNPLYLAVGCTIFSMGLFKKVVFADGMAMIADPVFAVTGSAVSPVDAWLGVTAFALQIYFDFSGYSDMAIGLSYMFGIRLPVNFFSPYKSTGIIEFWRRWNMTLSRFLRDYLYIPLGGNRKGPMRRHINLMITMLLGGLWHGAGWTFIVWGGLHGLYLIVNHGWRTMTKRFFPRVAVSRNLLLRMAFIALTFLCVTIAWVFFRATSLDSAVAMLKAMAGLNLHTGKLLVWTLIHGTQIAIPALLLVVFFTPNTLEIMKKFRPALDTDFLKPDGRRLAPAWKPDMLWGGVTALTLLIGLLTLFATGDGTQFLYFQF